jgi:arylformamidase
MLLGAAAMLGRPARAEDKVFLNYTQAELDRAYDQAAWAPDRAAIIASYASDSAAVRAAVPPQTVKYGSTDAEALDIFKPGNPGRLPIHVFLHGGAWTSLSKDDASALAPCFVDSGAVYIALGFANVPTVRLPDMVEQCRRALGWIAANAASFSGNADAIHISGHSSGAHLAAVLMTTDWAARGLPADLIKSTVLLSGIYELYPVMLSSRRNYLKLTPDEVAALSPMRHMGQLHGPVVVSVGDQESPEFKRQETEMADVLAGMGALRMRATSFNHNHFQMPIELSRPESPLGRAALSMMGLV